MRFASFKADGRPSYGVVLGDRVFDLGRRLQSQGYPTLRSLLGADATAIASSATADKTPDHRLAEVTLSPVIPDPHKIICIGMNYRDHVAETGRTVTENPSLFARFAGSQVAHGEPMVRPFVSHEFDYEGELAIIIGKGGRHISEEDALSHVAGYSCYNDGSIRDWQRHTTQFLAGKTFAGTGAFGPFLVTGDEVGDPTKLTLETRLNGQVVQHTTTDLLITPITTLIAYISTILPLLPGDVIVSGTPGGVGAKRKPPLWMQAGDTVEVEISKVGLLVNPIVDEAR
ncbi:MAG: fumarylacetoacetate hydrolase family protein [Roseiarcus sp.]|jgi:2-keto-4-pentenoate hydratase/2-oxohepta-3-ene-1,7-dioic acid hydratase in catechol pathway